MHSPWQFSFFFPRFGVFCRGLTLFEMRLAANFVFPSAYMMFHAGRKFFKITSPLLQTNCRHVARFGSSPEASRIFGHFTTQIGDMMHFRRPLPRNVVPVPGAAPRPKAMERRVFFVGGCLEDSDFIVCEMKTPWLFAACRGLFYPILSRLY